MAEMRIDQNESININVNNMNNSYISNGMNTSGYVSRTKSKYIKTKAKIELGWDDYFKSQQKKDDPKEIGNFAYA
jgi:hypothetical protein